MTAAATPLGYRPCAGVVLVNPAGLVFAGRRNDRPLGSPAAWQMPQGGIDPGEDLVTAALRELEEETGIPSSLVRVEGVAPGPVAYDSASRTSSCAGMRPYPEVDFHFPAGDGRKISGTTLEDVEGEYPQFYCTRAASDAGQPDSEASGTSPRPSELASTSGPVLTFADQGSRAENVLPRTGVFAASDVSSQV